MDPEPLFVNQSLPPRDVAPILGLDETVELLTRIPGGHEEDPDLSALFTALKTKLGLCDLKKPSSTMSLRVALLTRDLKSCRGIHSSPMELCRSHFHPRVRSVRVCNVDGTSEA